MLSEKKLRKWRKIALETKSAEYSEYTKMLAEFILGLTQELLDQHLIEDLKRKKSLK